VFDRIYAGVLAKIKEAGGAKALLYRWGYRRKAYFLAQGARHDQARPARRWLQLLLAAALPGAAPVLTAPRAPCAACNQAPSARTPACGRVWRIRMRPDWVMGLGLGLYVERVDTKGTTARRRAPGNAALTCARPVSSGGRGA
jgi:hypothetical protein